MEVVENEYFYSSIRFEEKDCIPSLNVHTVLVLAGMYIMILHRLA